MITTPTQTMTTPTMTTQTMTIQFYWFGKTVFLEEILLNLFLISMFSILLVRYYNFIRIRYFHFLWEFCYYINFLFLGCLLLDPNKAFIYFIPFLHGPLLFYSVLFGDSLHPKKFLSWSIHSYAALISWFFRQNINSSIIPSLYAIYMVWFIPYAFYCFLYQGTNKTMIRYVYCFHSYQPVYIKDKIIYLVGHKVTVLFSTYVGYIGMRNPWFDDLLIYGLVLSTLYHTIKKYKCHQ